MKLRPGEHFVEDVTDTLKRFFRELDDPVTAARLLPRWREAAGTPKISKNSLGQAKGNQNSTLPTRIPEALVGLGTPFPSTPHPGRSPRDSAQGKMGRGQRHIHPGFVSLKIPPLSLF